MDTDRVLSLESLDLEEKIEKAERRAWLHSQITLNLIAAGYPEQQVNKLSLDDAIALARGKTSLGNQLTTATPGDSPSIQFAEMPSDISYSGLLLPRLPAPQANRTVTKDVRGTLHLRDSIDENESNGVLEVFYGGIDYDNEICARWAMVFDELQIKFQYHSRNAERDHEVDGAPETEPEFYLESLRCYLLVVPLGEDLYNPHDLYGLHEDIPIFVALGGPGSEVEFWGQASCRSGGVTSEGNSFFLVRCKHCGHSAFSLLRSEGDYYEALGVAYCDCKQQHGDAPTYQVVPQTFFVPFNTERVTWIADHTSCTNFDGLNKAYARAVAVDMLYRLGYREFEHGVRDKYGRTVADFPVAQLTGAEIVSLLKESDLGVELLYIRSGKKAKGNMAGRLYDSVIASADPSATLKGAIVITADNVTAHVRGAGYQYKWDAHPTYALPFDRLFIETVEHSASHSYKAWGLCLWNSTQQDRRYIRGSLVYEKQDGDLILEVGLLIEIDELNQPLECSLFPIGDDPRREFCYFNVKSQRWEIKPYKLQTVEDMLNPLFAALSLTNCHNVELVDEYPLAHETKAHQKKYGQSLIQYKTIRINPNRTIKHYPTEQDEHERKNSQARDLPLTIVRGSEADYTLGRGLFGKYKIKVYRPAHLRGSIENGAIVKDYEVQAPQEAK